MLKGSGGREKRFRREGNGFKKEGEMNIFVSSEFFMVNVDILRRIFNFE